MKDGSELCGLHLFDTVESEFQGSFSLVFPVLPKSDIIEEDKYKDGMVVYQRRQADGAIVLQRAWNLGKERPPRISNQKYAHGVNKVGYHTESDLFDSIFKTHLPANVTVDGLIGNLQATVQEVINQLPQ